MAVFLCLLDKPSRRGVMRSTTHRRQPLAGARAARIRVRVLRFKRAERCLIKAIEKQIILIERLLLPFYGSRHEGSCFVGWY